MLGVPAECGNGVGYVDVQLNKCIVGRAFPEINTIFLAVGTKPYSYVLPHELLHIMYPDDAFHEDPEVWGGGEHDIGGLWAKGIAHLESFGEEFNTIRFVD